ncbi:MAG: radical SAM protein [Endomicrobiaceae bacterium]|nr:radical SAM protein [Endomicrobiaceae bacterium]
MNIEELKQKMKVLPKYPKFYPPYKVYWNWDISFKCNYKCSYCEVIKKDVEFNTQIADTGKWREVWDRIFDNYWCTHVRFSGGEPTIHPNFFPFLNMLLEKHTVDITTNLSFDLNKFLDKIKPGGLTLSASFHPEFVDFEKFFEKVKYLNNNGFFTAIAYVGYPPHLDKICEYKNKCEKFGIQFKIIPFIGIYKGKKYPESYDNRERMLLEGFTTNSKVKDLDDINKAFFKWDVEKEENKEAKETKSKLGKLCRMGQMYAKIHPDLTVTRCCAGYHGQESGILGNILDPKFKLLDDALPCEFNLDCPCFKGMFVNEYENTWNALWGSVDHPIYKLEYMKEYIKYLKTKV